MQPGILFQQTGLSAHGWPTPNGSFRPVRDHTGTHECEGYRLDSEFKRETETSPTTLEPMKIIQLADREALLAAPKPMCATLQSDYESADTIALSWASQEVFLAEQLLTKGVPWF